MTQDDVIRLAKEVGFERLGHTDDDFVCYPEEIVAFAKLVAEHEREACAVICENYADVDSGPDEIIIDYHAYLIRKRGEA